VAAGTFSAAAIYVAAKWGKIQTQDIEAKDLIINEEVQEKNGEINLGKGYTNIALFGVDSRDGNLGKGNRTDCIIVASLNNETKEVKMITGILCWIFLTELFRSVMLLTVMEDRRRLLIC
jgi:anionic cell wall polymer biosynthesis LytR-Cps2A-Psr (LCP) family protein